MEYLPVHRHCGCISIIPTAPKGGCTCRCVTNACESTGAIRLLAKPLNSRRPIPLARPITLRQPVVHVLAFRPEHEQPHRAVVKYMLDNGRGLRRRVLPVCAAGVVVDHNSSNTWFHLFSFFNRSIAATGSFDLLPLPCASTVPFYPKAVKGYEVWVASHRAALCVHSRYFLVHAVPVTASQHQ